MLANRVTRFITSIVGTVVILFGSILLAMMLFEDLLTYVGMLSLLVGVVHIVNEFLYDVLNFDRINWSMGGRIFKRVVYFLILAIITLVEYMFIPEVERMFDAESWFMRGVAYTAIYGGTIMAGYFLLATTMHWDTDSTVFAQPIAIAGAYIAGFIVSLLGMWVPFLAEYGALIMLGLLNAAMILYMIFVSLPYSEDPVDLG